MVIRWVNADLVTHILPTCGLPLTKTNVTQVLDLRINGLAGVHRCIQELKHGDPVLRVGRLRLMNINGKTGSLEGLELKEWKQRCSFVLNN